ncbi:MAG: hypothetical protein HC841_03450 [Verrucomicrobiae bacterium]|nr:hypothetical protein [Verrucomicrobiae bacterium]
MKQSLLPVASLTAMLVTGGCSNKLTFVTHTSLGLDVSGSTQFPDRVSLTYNRQEFAHVPEKRDGESHSVYGGLDSDIGFWSGAVIKQTFATGEAAQEATKPKPPRHEPPQPCCPTCQKSDPCECDPKPHQDTGDPLLFSTSSTYGLHLSFGDGQIKPTLLMGFRRVEATYIPISDSSKEVRPIYADILINSKPDDTPDTAPAWKVTSDFPTGNYSVRIKQAFATGQAAINLAKNNDNARTKLDAAANVDKAVGIMVKNKEIGLRIVDDIGKELDRLKNDQLDQAVDVFKAVRLIGNVRAVELKKPGIDARDKCRELKNEARKTIETDQLPTETLKQIEDLLAKLKKV